MRINKPILLPLALFIALEAIPLEADDNTVDALRSPSSPAFVLTGTAPSAIERPNTPKALFASISNVLASTKEGAIEFAPYWLFDHENLMYEDFVNPGFEQAVVQNASASLLFSPDSSKSSIYAVGLRSSAGPFMKKVDVILPELVQQQRANKVWLSALNAVINIDLQSDANVSNFESNVKKERDVAINTEENKNGKELDEKIKTKIFELCNTYLNSKLTSPPSLETLTQSVNMEIEKVRKSTKGLIISWQELRAAQKGLVVEAAGATSFLSESGEIKNGKLDGVGAWFTFLYPIGALDGLACIRWLRTDIVAKDQDDLDGGLRFLYARDRFELGGEGLLRWIVQESDLRYRVAITLKVIEASFGTLDLSAGKDYGPAGSDSSDQWFLRVGVTISGGSRISLLK